MTAETDLLPSSVAAFTEALKGGRGSLDAWLEVNNEREVAAHVEAYARARVSSATEALRAEVELERTYRLAAQAGLAFAEKGARQADARAERLAEALRGMVGASYAVCTTIDQRGHRWSEAYLDQALLGALAALEQENSDGREAASA